MPTTQDLTKLTINKVDCAETFAKMKAQGKVDDDELYFVNDDDSSTSITAHQDLTGTSLSDCHPISAISNLQDSLDDKIKKPVEGSNNQVLTTNGLGTYAWKTVKHNDVSNRNDADCHNIDSITKLQYNLDQLYNGEKLSYARYAHFIGLNKKDTIIDLYDYIGGEINYYDTFDLALSDVATGGVNGVITNSESSVACIFKNDNYTVLRLLNNATLALGDSTNGYQSCSKDFILDLNGFTLTIQNTYFNFIDTSGIKNFIVYGQKTGSKILPTGSPRCISVNALDFLGVYGGEYGLNGIAPSSAIHVIETIGVELVEIYDSTLQANSNTSGNTYCRGIKLNTNTNTVLSNVTIETTDSLCIIQTPKVSDELSNVYIIDSHFIVNNTVQNRSGIQIKSNLSFIDSKIECKNTNNLAIGSASAGLNIATTDKNTKISLINSIIDSYNLCITGKSTYIGEIVAINCVFNFGLMFAGNGGQHTKADGCSFNRINKQTEIYVIFGLYSSQNCSFNDIDTTTDTTTLTPITLTIDSPTNIYLSNTKIRSIQQDEDYVGTIYLGEGMEYLTPLTTNVSDFAETENHIYFTSNNTDYIAPTVSDTPVAGSVCIKRSYNQYYLSDNSLYDTTNCLPEEVIDHRNIANRQVAGAHPISAISGLEDELKRRANAIELCKYAKNISIADDGSYFTSNNIESALQEIGGQLEALMTTTNVATVDEIKTYLNI